MVVYLGGHQVLRLTGRQTPGLDTRETLRPGFYILAFAAVSVGIFVLLFFVEFLFAFCRSVEF